MNILGIPLSLIAAAAIFVPATVLATEILKRTLFCVDIRENRHSLILSWCVGVFFYVALLLMKFYPATFGSFIFFSLLTGILNAGYRYTRLKDWSRNMLKR